MYRAAGGHADHTARSTLQSSTSRDTITPALLWPRPPVGHSDTITGPVLIARSPVHRLCCGSGGALLPGRASRFCSDWFYSQHHPTDETPTTMEGVGVGGGGGRCLLTKIVRPLSMELWISTSPARGTWVWGSNNRLLYCAGCER